MANAKRAAGTPVGMWLVNDGSFCARDTERRCADCGVLHLRRFSVCAACTENYVRAGRWCSFHGPHDGRCLGCSAAVLP